MTVVPERLSPPGVTPVRSLEIVLQIELTDKTTDRNIIVGAPQL